MERFCGYLLPAVKNRIRPYEHIDNFIQRRAQMQIISTVHNFPALARPFVKLQESEGGIEISSREVVYEDCTYLYLPNSVNVSQNFLS